MAFITLQRTGGLLDHLKDTRVRINTKNIVAYWQHCEKTPYNRSRFLTGIQTTGLTNDSGGAESDVWWVKDDIGDIDMMMEIISANKLDE